MTKRSFSLLLALLFFIEALPLALASDHHSFSPEKDCADGKCVDDLVGLSRLKISSAKKEGCLPKKGQSAEAFYQDRALPVSCMKVLKEIEELNEKLLSVKRYLDEASANDGTCKDCKTIKNPAEGLLENIKDISKTNSDLACTEKRKAEVWNKCGDDFSCFIVGSASPLLGMGAWGASLVKEKSTHVGSCSLGEDNCYAQIMSMFTKSVFSLVETIVDLAWGGIKKIGTNCWQKLMGVEDKSSSAQFAALKASENEGFFQELRKDFTGTMGKVWSGLVAALEHWFSNEVMCQEWSGRAHFSACVRPYQGLGCTSCKTFLNGICGLGGRVLTDVFTNFVTGGLFTAAKYGVSGAAKLAKIIRVSPKALEMAKKTKLVKAIEVAKSSKVAVGAAQALKKSFDVLGTYLLSPLSKNATAAIQSLYKVAKASGTFVMMTDAGPVIIFGKKALKTAGKVVVYPINNPLYNKSFDLGAKYTEKLLKGGAEKASVMRAVPVVQDRAVDKAYVEKTLKNDEKTETNYLSVLKETRANSVSQTLGQTPSIKLNRLIDEYYPELNYGKMAKRSGPSGVEKSERELKQTLDRLPAGEDKERLLREFDERLSSKARASVVSSRSFTREEALKNASLTDEDRFLKALTVLGIDSKKLSPAKLKALKEALAKTKTIGSGLFHYSSADKKLIQKILQEQGISEAQSDLLIRGGLAGHARPEDLSVTLRKVAVPEVTAHELKAISERSSYSDIFKSLPVERKPTVAKTLKLFEEAGLSEKTAATTYKNFEPYFKSIQSKVARDADAEPMLAEFISRQKKARVSDSVIKKKLDDTFGPCK